jgi:predicted anti-sigma-YlaC factor YlaD
MKCRDVEKMLSAYSDGESPTETNALIESHVRSCESCLRLREENRTIWKALEALPAAKPSPFFYAKLRSRIQSEERLKRTPWTERLLIPASAVAIAIVGFWLGTIASANGDTSKQDGSLSSTIAAASYVDTFDSVPSTSFGDVYFALAGQE